MSEHTMSGYTMLEHTMSRHTFIFKNSHRVKFRLARSLLVPPGPRKFKIVLDRWNPRLE
jgi:hypothetical protein